MKIAVSGSTGFIGTQLVSLLTANGHTIKKLVRSGSASGDSIAWNPDGQMDKTSLEGMDVVVHLAGENISQRWNAERKKQIRDSRVKGTRALSEALASLQNPPKALVCASAIGYYGNRGNTLLTEESSPGQGFLAEVCREWEEACKPAAEKGIRVVNLRIGVVLHPSGGALQKMLLPFKLGAGGVVGSGKQYWSWVALEDVVGALHHAIVQESLQGPVNAVSPNPVTNEEFTKTLGHVLHRPTIFPLPAFAARIALGEMADDLLLSSARIHPAKLIASTYQFQYPDLDGALRHMLA